MLEKYPDDFEKAQNFEKISNEMGKTFTWIEGLPLIELRKKKNVKNIIEQHEIRAMQAAQGNIKKAEELLELMEEYPLTKYQKQRVNEYGKKYPKASAKKIFDEAIKPRVKKNIMISLPEDVRKGLKTATKEFLKEQEEIVAEIIEKWVYDQGFLSNDNVI